MSKLVRASRLKQNTCIEENTNTEDYNTEEEDYNSAADSQDPNTTSPQPKANNLFKNEKNLKRKFVKVEDDTDDEDYNPNQATNKQLRASSEDRSQKSPVDKNSLNMALQKCHEIAVAMKKIIINCTLATKATTSTSTSTATPSIQDKLVFRSTLNAACGIDPNDVTSVVKPYQICGVNFFLMLYRLHIKGGILADEMGLGKTIQAVAYLAVLKHMHGDSGPHLVVAPSSVLENWKRELAKWCPSFKVVVCSGKEKAAEAKRLTQMALQGEAREFDVLITSYSVFEKNGEQMKKDREFLKMWPWSCVVMDEGHLLKDPASCRTKKLQKLVENARQRIMLTGTPVQNDLHELWSLLSFLMPDTFKVCGDDLYEFLGTRNHGIQDHSSIAKIQALLRPFVLRRTKAEVLEHLPSKSQHVLYVKMVDDQENAYQETLQRYRNIPNGKEAVCDASSKRDIKNVFTHMRKLSNHPLLVRRHFTNDVVKQLAKMFHSQGVFGESCSEKQVLEELSSRSDFSLNQLCKEYVGQARLPNDVVLLSSKCRLLAELLPHLKRGGHRCLIFSQWTTILDILECALDVLRYRFLRLDGSTDVAQRQTLVDEYNNNPDVFIFLISTRAGGQGLNLTGADTVIIHDVDFNPQIDRQAEDRCHRIGQSKPVTVYRLVTKGTVDEGILKIAENKLILDEEVLQTRHELRKDEQGKATAIETAAMKQILSEHVYC